MIKVSTTIMEKSGTKVEKFIRKCPDYTSRYKRVILPEGSPLKESGIDVFELRIDSDDKIKRLSAGYILEDGNILTLMNGSDKIKHTIALLKEMPLKFDHIIK